MNIDEDITAQIPAENQDKQLNIDGLHDNVPADKRAEESQEIFKQKEPIKHQNKFDKLILIGICLLAVFSLAFLVWLYLPNIRTRFTVQSSPTSTPSAKTVTPRSTHTPPIKPTQTLQRVPSLTPLPLSKYIKDASELNPQLQGLSGNVIVLDDDMGLTAEPDFSSPRWTASSQIAQQLGVLITEPYYATLGPGSLTWRMDKPLPAGAYEIFVMDTVYSSAGTFDFNVKLGELPLSPLTSTNRIVFLSTRGEPAQTTDNWRNIGIYNLGESNDLLSISTSWTNLEENEIAVADRVLIVPFPESNSVIVNALPADRTRFIMDETRAQFDGIRYMVPVTGKLAWGTEFQTIVNPDSDVRVTWEYPELLPVGTYEIAIWIPENDGNAFVTYRVLINGLEVPRSDGQTLTFQQGNHPGGQWLSLGAWTTPRIFEKPVTLALVMLIPANTSGVAAIDAAAFLYSSP